MRQYAPGVYDGEPAPFRYATDRKALIGKRIGYDYKGSSMLCYGRVTAAEGRNIEIDGSWFYYTDITQIVVLKEQYHDPIHP